MDLFGSNSNILMKEDATLCIFKHHLVHTVTYMYLYLLFFCHGTNPIPICKNADKVFCDNQSNYGATLVNNHYSFIQRVL